MAMTRQERISSHKKQERLQIKQGVPDPLDLAEGVPVLRETPNGLIEYVRYNGVLHERGGFSVRSAGAGQAAALTSNPDYDSGWVTVTNGNTTTHYDFTHNLRTKILLTQCYLKDTDNSDRIFNISTQFMDTVVSGSDGLLSFYHETLDNIAVCTGNDYVFVYDNTPHSNSSVQLASADIRILAWKLSVQV